MAKTIWLLTSYDVEQVRPIYPDVKISDISTVNNEVLLRIADAINAGDDDVFFMVSDASFELLPWLRHFGELVRVRHDSKPYVDLKIGSLDHEITDATPSDLNLALQESVRLDDSLEVFKEEVEQSHEVSEEFI